MSALSFPTDAHVSRSIGRNSFIPRESTGLSTRPTGTRSRKTRRRSCGFGPHDRDDVGLWISLMPVSVDSDRLAEELPKILNQVLPQMQGGNVRRDPTLRHYGVKADVHKEGEGGHYWLIAGGDVVLFASSQLPAAERDIWNPTFEHLMATLEITRDEELALRQLTNEVLALLRQRHPEQDFRARREGDPRAQPRRVPEQPPSGGPRGARPVGPRSSSISCRAWANPWICRWGRKPGKRRRARLLPLLKPRSYLESDSATRHSLVNEWLADVVICYALRSKDIFRFVTTADADRWQTDAQALHQVAIANLCRLAWPTRLEGARQRDGGRVDRRRDQRRAGVEPTPPSRPAPAVQRPPREPVPGRHPGSRYPRRLFRPAPPQAADRAPVAQGSSHVGLSHHPPALSRDARRHRTGEGVMTGRCGVSRASHSPPGVPGTSLIRRSSICT